MSAFASWSLDKIEQSAIDSLNATYQDSDEISVFGFSRGAAIARRFVSRLGRTGLASDEKEAEGGRPVPVKFLGVWDTVLAEGVPEKGQEIRNPEELGEIGGIGDHVEKVFHFVSIDDPRKVFTPTLFAQDNRVDEIWFAGVHSDVGGGYRQSGLSDITLEFMLTQAATHASINFVSPNDVDLQKATDGQIDHDDIMFKPDVEADDHVKDLDSKLRNIFRFRGSRKVMVLKGGKPILNDSVVERGRKISNYRPDNLDELEHKVRGDLSTVYQSFSDHFSD